MGMEVNNGTGLSKTVKKGLGRLVIEQKVIVNECWMSHQIFKGGV
jgi:hypothetical protein